MTSRKDHSEIRPAVHAFQTIGPANKTNCMTVVTDMITWVRCCTKLVIFIARQHAMRACRPRYCLQQIRLSVRPSVSLSNAGVMNGYIVTLFNDP